MTEFLDANGGRIAYDVTGDGPLVVLSHGIGDRRQVYRFLARRWRRPATGWATATCAGTASPAWAGTPSPAPMWPANLLALIRHLGEGVDRRALPLRRGRHHRRREGAGTDQRHRRDQPVYQDAEARAWAASSGSAATARGSRC